MIIETAEVNGERREAAFSECGKYRYRLDICFDATLRQTLTTICLNPSTATHLEDDPTIRRCKQFARELGCGSYRMLNLFALRSTDYKALFRSADPIGPENTLDFLDHWASGSITVAAWGAHVKERNWRHFYRGEDVLERLPGLQCWKVTKSGAPQHPLYLPKAAILKRILEYEGLGDGKEKA